MPRLGVAELEDRDLLLPMQVEGLDGRHVVGPSRLLRV